MAFGHTLASLTSHKTAQTLAEQVGTRTTTPEEKYRSSAEAPVGFEFKTQR